MTVIYKELWKNHIRYGLIALLTVILCITILFEFQSARRSEIGLYENVQYQYILNACSYDQVDQFKKQAFTKNITSWKAYSSMVLCCGNKNIEDVCVFIVDPSEDNLAYTFFSEERCLKHKQGTVNGICIDYTLARELHAGIGDRILFDLEDTKNLEYEVIGIYEDTVYAGKYTAMLMYDGAVKDAIDSTGETPWLSGAFYTTSDENAFNQYLHKNPYYPEQYFLDQTADKTASEQAMWFEEMKEKDWSSMITDVSVAAEEYNSTGLFSSYLTYGLSFAAMLCILIIMIRNMLILADETISRFQIPNLLGYSNIKCNAYMLGLIFIIYGSFMLLGDMIAALIVNRGPFGGLYVTGELKIITLIVQIAILLISMLLFILKCKRSRNEYNKTNL